MKTFEQFLFEIFDPSAMTSDTHSIIDGLNRAKHAILKGMKTVPARIIDKSDLKPLTPDEIEQHKKQAEEAKKKDLHDHFTGSTFGDSKARYSVAAALKASKKKPIVNLPTHKGSFVHGQVTDWWQGDEERARRADVTKPILVMNN